MLNESDAAFHKEFEYVIGFNIRANSETFIVISIKMRVLLIVKWSEGIISI
jgi:hypothetical protein